MKTSDLFQNNNILKLFNSFIYLVLLSSITLTSCKSSNQQPADAPPPLLPVSEVRESDAITFTDYPAAIQGAVDIDIRPQVSGYLQSVKIDEGAYVKAGQTLFKINDKPYREVLNNALAALHAAEAAMLNAKIELEKISPLVTNHVVSDIQLKTANASYQVAKANVEQAKAGVGTAKINLGYTNVKATLNGYIGRIPKKQGSLVSPQDTEALTQLSEIKKVHVYFALAENDFNIFNRSYPGKSQEARITGLPEVELVLADGSIFPVKGRIDMIDGQFDKSTGAITLRATFINHNEVLRSGNTGKIRLSMQHKNTIRVPQAATVEMQDKIFVYVLGEANKVSKQPINIIGKSGSDYLVKDGLKSGDQIVLSGVDHIQEGQLIQPDKKSAKAAKLIY